MILKVESWIVLRWIKLIVKSALYLMCYTKLQWITNINGLPLSSHTGKFPLSTQMDFCLLSFNDPLGFSRQTSQSGGTYWVDCKSSQYHRINQNWSQIKCFQESFAPSSIHNLRITTRSTWMWAITLWRSLQMEYLAERVFKLST